MLLYVRLMGYIYKQGYMHVALNKSYTLVSNKDTATLISPIHALRSSAVVASSTVLSPEEVINNILFSLSRGFFDLLERSVD